MSTRIIVGDVRAELPTLASESVRCIVTSPPYFGLRDYGAAGQIGLESDSRAYLDQIVTVFREARRVLANDGTLWLNMGDSYAGSWGAQAREHAGKHAPNVSALSANQVKAAQIREGGTGSLSRTPGLKSKDLVGMPWRVAFALQEDGWYLRQDIIWAKPNPMPESVRDRCTKAHEYLFLFSKSRRYYFDAAAISEPSGGWKDSAFDDGKNAEVHSDVGKKRAAGRVHVPSGWDTGDGAHGTVHRDGRSQTPEYREKKRSGNKARKPASARGVPVDTNGQTNGAVAGSVPWEGDRRNKRSVWTIATASLSEAHFATFPPALVEPCILAGTKPGDTVLDPFGGAGTTGLVADRLGRHAILIELNPEYAAMAQRRIERDSPLFAQVTA